MIRDQESRRLFETHKYNLGRVVVEPVWGCGEFICPSCSLEVQPGKQQFMRQENLKKALKFLKTQGANPPEFQFSMRGEPFDHPKLGKIVETIREHYPKAWVSAISSLSGIKDYKTLESRANGLNALVVSVDGHHYARLLSILNREGELTPEKLSAKGFATKREAVFEEMRKRLRWAAEAGAKADFRLLIQLTGSNKERKIMDDIVRSALTPDQLKRTNYTKPEIRRERGYDLRLTRTSRSLHILHDGGMSFFIPEN